jgi:LacI family transcriptional regulator
MSQLFLEALTEQVMHGGQTLQRFPYPLPSANGDDLALRDALAGYSRVIFMGLDYIHWAEYLQSVHTMPIYLSGLWMPHRVNAILYDVAGTQKRVIEHLIELGHRKIAFAGRIGTRDDEQNKFLCYYRTLRAHGIKPDPDWAVPAVNSQIDGYLAARTLIQRVPPDRRPTAIAADTDNKAIGVITAIREAGLSVPGDISVVGLDNRPIARACDPQLTTAGPRWSEVGRTILDAIESMGRRPGPSPVRVHLPTELVVRASSMAPAHP